VDTNTPFSTLQESQWQYRPWLDKDDPQNVLFCSVHLFKSDEEGCGFFPGTGEENENTSSDSQIYPGGVLNVPLPPGNAHGYKWRSRFTKIIFPRLLEF
jgi:acetoin utilization deacetylase AcuC-like enzyme